ncbi:hypothetical protein [Haloimpatiens massiliensis]|uniref:hypothetical protein n=1 Tax=Haloimpatiens massiliensis TaxID=1658110 RepID=UPI000C84DB47|nr:hypothetical protein [Haloimpatiens massiliensis]
MSKASYAAKGGLFAALSILLIYLSTIIYTNRLFFLGAASLIIPLCILMLDIKYALLVYLVSSIVSLWLLGPRGTVVAYTLFFGIYGIIKFYIEKLRNMPLEIVLKLLTFNIFLIAVYTLFKFIFMESIASNYLKYKYIIFFVSQFVFLFYDYILTIFISYSNNRFIRKFK